MKRIALLCLALAALVGACGVDRDDTETSRAGLYRLPDGGVEFAAPID